MDILCRGSFASIGWALSPTICIFLLNDSHKINQISHPRRFITSLPRAKHSSATFHFCLLCLGKGKKIAVMPLDPTPPGLLSLIKSSSWSQICQTSPEWLAHSCCRSSTIRAALDSCFCWKTNKSWHHVSSVKPPLVVPCDTLSPWQQLARVDLLTS